MRLLPKRDHPLAAWGIHLNGELRKVVKRENLHRVYGTSDALSYGSTLDRHFRVYLWKLHCRSSSRKWLHSILVYVVKWNASFFFCFLFFFKTITCRSYLFLNISHPKLNKYSSLHCVGSICDECHFICFKFVGAMFPTRWLNHHGQRHDALGRRAWSHGEIHDRVCCDLRRHSMFARYHRNDNSPLWWNQLCAHWKSFLHSWIGTLDGLARLWVRFAAMCMHDFLMLIVNVPLNSYPEKGFIWLISTINWAHIQLSWQYSPLLRQRFERNPHSHNTHAARAYATPKNMKDRNDNGKIKEMGLCLCFSGGSPMGFEVDLAVEVRSWIRR